MELKQFQTATGITLPVARRWYLPVSDALEEFGITAPEDKAMFLAQSGHESAGFSSLEESFNYTPAGLLSTFGSRITSQQAYALARTRGKPADQRAIANLVYYRRLGNRGAEDGWNYRGRGLMQLTGRKNYRLCGAALSIDLLTEPELLREAIPAARSAAWYFSVSGCIGSASDLIRVTRLISGGKKGLSERAERLERAKAVLL